MIGDALEDEDAVRIDVEIGNGVEDANAVGTAKQLVM